MRYRNTLALLMTIGALLTPMIPIPPLIVDQVVHPLQLIATKLAAVLLHLAGIPVLLNGNMMTLDAALDVVTLYVRIRFLLTLVMLAIIYGYLLKSRIWLPVVLACSAVPIAVAGASFRIFGTCLMWHYWDLDTHVYWGWLIFVLELITLIILHRVISFIWKSSPKPKSA